MPAKPRVSDLLAFRAEPELVLLANDVVEHANKLAGVEVARSVILRKALWSGLEQMLQQQKRLLEPPQQQWPIGESNPDFRIERAVS